MSESVIHESSDLAMYVGYRCCMWYLKVYLHLFVTRIWSPRQSDVRLAGMSSDTTTVATTLRCCYSYHCHATIVASVLSFVLPIQLLDPSFTTLAPTVYPSAFAALAVPLWDNRQNAIREQEAEGGWSPNLLIGISGSPMSLISTWT